MNIRRIRMVVPARLQPEALAFARETAKRIAIGLPADGSVAALSAKLPGLGLPAPLLSRAAAAAVIGSAKSGRR